MNKNRPYLPEIDGLRALAVLAIMVYHLKPEWLPGGFNSVGVFFVISGFVISRSLSGSPVGSLSQFVLNFYHRRIFRLMPALIVCLLASVAFTTFFFPQSFLTELSNQVSLAAFFAFGNFKMMQLNTDYFTTHFDLVPASHTWSLGIEEQYYFIFPFIFYFWLKGNAPRRFWPPMVVLTIGSFAVATWWSYSNPSWAYLHPLSRFWEIGVGVLLFQYRPELKLINQKWQKGVFGILGMLLIVGSFVFSHHTDPQVLRVLPAILGTAMLISLINLGTVPWLSSLITFPAAVFMGKISYSFYLWQVPIFSLFNWTVGLEAAAYVVLAVALVFGCALISYYFIENPIRYSVLRWRMPRAYSFAAAITLLLSFYGASNYIISNARLFSYSTTGRDHSVWSPTALIRRFPKSCVPKITSQVATFTMLTKIVVTHCENARATGRLIVAGDSFANDYRYIASILGSDLGIEVWVMSTPSCPFTSLLTPATNDSASCAKARAWMLEKIRAELQPDDILFLANLQLFIFPLNGNHETDEIARRAMFENPESQELARGEVRKLITELRPRVAGIIFEAPRPVFKSPPFRCADWFNKNHPICKRGFEVDRQELLTLRQPIMDGIATLPDIKVFDPFPLLCPTSPCNAFRNNKPLFLDSYHLTAYGSKQLYGRLKELVVQKLSHNAVTRAHSHD